MNTVGWVTIFAFVVDENHVIRIFDLGEILEQFAVESAHECFDTDRVKLFAREFLQFANRGFNGQSFAVWAIGGHSIKGVGNTDDATGERNIFAGEMFRVTAAIIIFVVMQYPGDLVGKKIYRAQNLRTNCRVLLDDGVFFIGQATGFANKTSFDADLGDIGQQSGIANAFDFFWRQIEFFGNRNRMLGIPA